MPIYRDRNNIEEPQIISQTKRLPKGVYPKEMLNRIEKFTGDDYISNLIDTSRYTVTGSAVGLIGGIAIAMFLKKGKWGGALIGAMVGAGLGYGYTKLKEKIGSKTTETTTTKSK